MAESLHQILTELRIAVVEGNYGRLAAILPELEQAEGHLTMDDPAELQALKAQAMRAAGCLDSALSGVRAARRRIAEIDDAARGLTTYDRDGVKATVPSHMPTSRRV